MDGLTPAYVAWIRMGIYVVALLFVYLNAKRGINLYRPPITWPISRITILEVWGLLSIVLVWLLVFGRPLTLRNILEHTIGFALAGWLLSAMLRSIVDSSSPPSER